jgi:hypothetical protein
MKKDRFLLASGEKFRLEIRDHVSAWMSACTLLNRGECKGRNEDAVGLAAWNRTGDQAGNPHGKLCVPAQIVTKKINAIR